MTFSHLYICYIQCLHRTAHIFFESKDDWSKLPMNCGNVVMFQPLQDKRVIVGQKVALECQVEGHPEPVVKWLKDGQNVTQCPDYEVGEYLLNTWWTTHRSRISPYIITITSASFLYSACFCIDSSKCMTLAMNKFLKRCALQKNMKQFL